MTVRWLLLPSGILAGWIGCAYILGDPIRTSTPSFGIARGIAPLSAWGWLFLTGGVVLLVASLLGRLKIVAYAALLIGGAIYSWWASLFLVTLAVDDRASIVAPGVYYFVGFSHFAGAWRMAHSGQSHA